MSTDDGKESRRSRWVYEQTMSLAHRKDPSDGVTDQVRNEILAVLDRWAVESDLTISQAIAAVDIVHDDLMRLLKEGPAEQEEGEGMV